MTHSADELEESDKGDNGGRSFGTDPSSFSSSSEEAFSDVCTGEDESAT